MKSISLLVVTILISYTNTLAQVNAIEATPEKNLIDGSFIEAYTNQWRVSVIDSTGRKQTVRHWTDYAHILELDGTSYLHRVQDLYDPSFKLQETWINVVKHEDLTPHRFSSENSNGNLLLLEFENQQVLQSGYVEDEFRKENFQTNNKLYDWNLYGMLLVGLPFKENTSYKILFWSDETRSEKSLVASIAEQEYIETLSGIQYHTQKVLTDQRLTFWLVKEKPYVIQLALSLPNESTMIWEMK